MLNAKPQKMFWLRKIVAEFSYSKFITDIYSELGTNMVVNIQYTHAEDQKSFLERCSKTP